jgi:hypothetical protein
MPGDPLWVNASAGVPAYAANELRQAMAAVLLYDGRPLGARQGIRPGGTGLNVQLAGATITVKAGVGIVDPGLSSPQGPYWVALPADETHTLAAADPTNPRKDLVVARVYDHDEDGSGLRTARSEYTAGVPAPSPGLPAQPAGSIRLASIDVPASGGGSPVVNLDGPYAVAAGGLLPVRTQAAQDALDEYPGLFVYRIDTFTPRVWDGAAWRSLVTAPQKAAANASRVHWGTFAGNTDSTGNLVVTHGAGFTPAAGVVAAQAPSGATADIPGQVVGPFSFTATQFTVRAWQISASGGAVLASKPMTVAFLVWT